MITSDLEHIDRFIKEFDNEAAADTPSVESFVNNTGITVSTFEDVTRVKRSFAKTYLDAALADCPCDSKKESVQFIKKSNVDQYLLIVDLDILVSLWSSTRDKINSMLKFIENITEKATVNVISMLPADSTVWMITDFIAIGNLLRLIKGKTVFNINAQLSFNDMFIASFCDELVVSQFASISISEAANQNNALPAMQAAYQEYIKGTYNYWVEKGLFTAEEVTNLFSSESTSSINLQSSEIRSRLGL